MIPRRGGFPGFPFVLYSIKEGDCMATEAQKRAVLKYDAKNTRQYHLKLNLTTDADIIDYLSGLDNVQGFIKRAIRCQIGCQIENETAGTPEE